MRKLLEAMTKFAGQPEQKPGEQWKGTDTGTPGKKLVGDSIIKDLSKGVTPKTKEEELAEAFANFNEDDLGVEEKRPHRTGTRADKVGVRGHKEQPRYKTVKDIDEDSLDNEYEGGESDNDYFDRQKPKKLSKRSQQRDNAADARKIGSFSVDGKVVRSNVNGLDHAQVAKELSNKYPGKNIEWKMTSKPFNEGWMNGSDRVNLPDGPMTYWNGTGRLQNEYNELYEKLVPGQGAAETIEGEVLRASSKIVYRHFNDGDLFNQASFDQLEQYIGRVANYDDLAEKAIEFALKAQGNYHPNTGWDSLDVMDYGPEEEEEYDDEEDDEDDYQDWEDPNEDNLDEGEHDAEFIDHEDNWYNMADWARAEFKKGKSVEEVIKYLRDNDYLGPRDINNFMKTVRGEKWNESVEEGKHFKTAYGWAGGRNEKTGKMYKHPDQIKADREAKKSATAQQSKDAMNNMFGGDAEDLTQNLKIKEAGMPSSVIKHKQALASKTPEALYAGFKQVADKQGKSVESLARSAAWRHGYGKGNGQGSAHYWDKIKHLGETVSEADMFKAGQRAIKNIKSTEQQRKSEAEKMAIAQAQIDADRENERDRFSQEELYPSDDSHDLDESTGPEIFTGYNEWVQEVAYSVIGGHPKFKRTDSQELAIDRDSKKIVGVWDNNDGEGTAGQNYVFDDGVYVISANEGWEANLAKTNRERMKKERAAAIPAKPLAKAKPNYDRVFQDINSAIGDTFPDGDPMDALMRKYRDSYGDLNIDLLNKACRVNGAKSYHDYVAKVWQQYMQDNPDLVQGGNPWVAEGEVSTRKYEMMLRNGQVKKFVAKDDADAKRIAAGHGAKSVIRMKGNVPGNKIAENDHPQHYVDRYNKDLERKIDKDFDPDYDRSMSDQEFEAKLKQRGKERNKGVAEGWESGPEERTTRERDPDAEYDARRQEKLDAEADSAPKTTTYQCVGRGPNDEPNYKFGPEHNTSEEAVAYRKKLMANPKTPNPRDIGIRTISKVAKGINEVTKSTYVGAMQKATDPNYTGDADSDKIVNRARKQQGNKFADDLGGVHKGHWPATYGKDDKEVERGYDKLSNRTPARVTAAGKANKQDVSALKGKIRTNEDITSSDPLEGALLDAIQELISQGHTDVDPMVLTNMVVAATSQPFLLKDLVDANNNSQAVQHYIDSISPSKVKFSSDMLTVKNEDPAKDKAKAQAGVSSMASRAANRNRLGEGTETPLQNKEDYNAKRKALQDIQLDPDTAKDPQLKAEVIRRLASLNQQYSMLREQISKFKESRGHKVIATKLGNMDRMQNVQVPSPVERQEQLRIAKAKEEAGKKQVKEFAAPGMNPATPVATNTAAKPDPAAVAKAAAATNTLKAATGTVVAPATLDKALDSATQGTATSTDVKALAPIMGVVNKAASDPKLAAQFKNLANQAKTTP